MKRLGMNELGEVFVEGGSRAVLPWRAIAEGEAAASQSFGYSPPVTLGGRLKFPNIFVPENGRTFVHLAQAVQEYRNIDVLIFILVFEWLEAAMEKGVFYPID
jgi:hypothetical protein